MKVNELLPVLIQRVSTLEAAQTTSKATILAAQTTATIALVAASISFVGVIITGLIAWRNAFVQARTTQQLKHAEFRQKWIDDLRAEMARFSRLTSSPGALSKKRPEILHSMYMIMMRMDREDEDHDNIFNLMNELINASDVKTDDEAKKYGASSARFLSVCQKILKREWEVLKGDMHATPRGWPFSALAASKRLRQRAERVEINRRRREGIPLTPNREWSLGCFRAEWIARQKPKGGASKALSIGRLLLRCEARGAQE